MRRFLILLLFVAAPAFAFRQFPPPGSRIGVLRMSGDFAYGADQIVAKTVQSDLCNELRNLSFDAFDARTTFHEIARSGGPAADFYVEVVSGNAMNRPVGGGGVGNGSIGFDVAVVVSRVVAEVRVYDQTLQLIDHYDLQREMTAIIPTAIDFGGRFFWARISLPFIQYAQYRAAAHAVAQRAGARIAGR